MKEPDDGRFVSHGGAPPPGYGIQPLTEGATGCTRGRRGCRDDSPPVRVASGARGCVRAHGLRGSVSLWQLAAHHMQPAMLAQLHASTFSAAIAPSPAMVVWAACWGATALVLALRSFQKRPL